MQKLADISMFESLQQTANERMGVGHLAVFNPVENDGLDLASNPDGSVSSGRVPPAGSVPHQQNPSPDIPQWGQSLGGRVGKLESRMDSLEHKVDAGFAEVKQTFAEVKQTFAEMKQDMVTKDDLRQFMGNR